jgi:hypothetical protein
MALNIINCVDVVMNEDKGVSWNVTGFHPNETTLLR